MRVRLADNHSVAGLSGQFVPNGMGEVVVHFVPNGDCDAMFASELEVLLNAAAGSINGDWVNMSQAFKDRDLIPDNYERTFREPADIAERMRGWY